MAAMSTKRISVTGSPAVNEESLLATVLARAEAKGDLPIFNASVSKIRQVSSDPDACAMELAQTVMKDANLCTRVLRIANSPMYSRGIGRIGSISRAVVVLGFDAIKNLCLTVKLIDSFQQEHPAIGMPQMVARAYFSAGFVKHLALECAVKDAEEAYLCGLLHGLGEIAVACYVPEKFNELVETQRRSNVTWLQAQQRILGITLEEIGQKLAATWNFSSRMAATMSRYRPAVVGPARNKDDLNHALAALGSGAVGKFYVDRDESTGTLRELLGQLAEATGIRTEKLEQSLTQSFQASCDLARDYGLSAKVLQPTLRASSDDLRDRLSREFAFYAANQGNVEAESSSGLPGTGRATRQPQDSAGIARTAPEPGVVYSSNEASPNGPSATADGTDQSSRGSRIARGDPFVQLEIIQEITAMVTQGTALNTVFIKILEGLKRGVGFQRTVLGLLNTDRRGYQPRIIIGDDTAVFRAALTSMYSEDGDLFCRAMTDGSDFFIEAVDSAVPPALLSAARIRDLGVSSFIGGGIRSGRKPLGFFFADNGIGGPPVAAEQRRGFSQFVAQARLAVQVHS
jgi:HD-like signal output (HDOD) protein